MKKFTSDMEVSVDNIYQLDGRVPVGKAIPFGLQHVLAMFVANLVPILIVMSAALVDGGTRQFTPAEIAGILQCGMFAAGIDFLHIPSCGIETFQKASFDGRIKVHNNLLSG